MDFFVYSRDAAGTGALRDDQGLLEEHWSYMDGFAGSMIARGPTLGADRDTATGSLHVLGLPNIDAAREFVAREPNNRAGVYAEHSIWRFKNLLGRTMWEFPSAAADESKFLIIVRSDRGHAGQERHAIRAREPFGTPAGAVDPLRCADHARQRRASRRRTGRSGSRRGAVDALLEDGRGLDSTSFRRLRYTTGSSAADADAGARDRALWDGPQRVISIAPAEP